jgi:probable rRNA maturation factor
MVTVEIINQQKKIPLNPARIVKIVRKIFKHEHVHKAQLSVVFVTDRKIRSLNKEFLQQDCSTDVLAFDYTAQHPRLDGEIVISATTAYKNARRFGTSSYEELILYVVHGILHLLGYDDHGAKDIKKMRAREKKLMLMINDEL